MLGGGSTMLGEFAKSLSPSEPMLTGTARSGCECLAVFVAVTWESFPLARRYLRFPDCHPTLRACHRVRRVRVRNEAINREQGG